MQALLHQLCEYLVISTDLAIQLSISMLTSCSGLFFNQGVSVVQFSTMGA